MLRSGRPADDTLPRALPQATDPSRGVLGLLASMMEHSCKPSAAVSIAPVSEGSVITLRTKRDVYAGEKLSICYVDFDAPVDERRRQLEFQHNFLCQCERCCLEAAIMEQVG